MGILFSIYRKASARHQVRFEEMADWRGSFENWTTVLSLLVSTCIFQNVKELFGIVPAESYALPNINFHF